MEYNKYELYFSIPRIARYLNATLNDEVKAKRLYKINIQLSQSFFALLTILEVVLRNKLQEELSKHFSSDNWIIEEKMGFMSHPSLTYKDRRTGSLKTESHLKDEVTKAEARITKNYGGTGITANRIISEQTLGFWSSFFDNSYYRILLGSPIKIFSSLPSGIGRPNIYKKLNDIREFRNRIYHNEPICFDSLDNIDATNAEKIKNDIKNILDWIDTDICLEIADINNIDTVINDLIAL